MGLALAIPLAVSLIYTRSPPSRLAVMERSAGFMSPVIRQLPPITCPRWLHPGAGCWQFLRPDLLGYANLTAVWLQRDPPVLPVLLIIDFCQLPRAIRAFLSLGLAVIPRVADPALSAHQRNRLALREASATSPQTTGQSLIFSLCYSFIRMR